MRTLPGGGYTGSPQKHHPDHAARRHVEHATLATETFGPLHMYGIHEPVAMNDNVPAGYRRTEPKDGFSEDGLVPIDRYGPPSVPVAQQPAPSLAEFWHMPGFIYLGSPYSLYSGGHDEAARVVSAAAAQLMERGVRIYAPISHGHFVSQHGSLPHSWDFWKDQCQPMIDTAAALIVLMMDGWRDSVGLNYEIDEFSRARKRILYLDPAQLGVEELGVGEMRAAA